MARRGLLSFAVLLGGVVFAVGVAGAAPLGQVTEFSSGLSAGVTLQSVMAAGPDGNVWFLDHGTTPSVGVISPSSGAITEYGIAANGGNTGSVPQSMAAGPDGDMWFTDHGATPAIGVLNPSTHAVSEFSVGLNPGSVPFNITTGPDGNMWFSDESTTTPAIGMINPTTHAIAEYSITGNGGNAGSIPATIGFGPDGNVWFTDKGTTKAIGKISPTTHVVSEYSTGLNRGSNPQGLRAGPDGNVWFTDTGTIRALGKITPAGVITEFSSVVPTVVSISGNTLMLSQAATASGTATLQFAVLVTVAVTKGSTTITDTSGSFPAGVEVGMSISGTDLAAGTTVLGVSGSTLTMSQAATGSETSIGEAVSASVANVTTTAGSTSVTVTSGGFSLVSIGDTVTGSGIPTGILNPGASPVGITTGADGDMWFTDSGTGVTPATPAIGRIDPATGVVTEFTEPVGMNTGSKPQGIAVGADGNLWFSDLGTTEAIGRFGVGAPAASVTAPSVTGSGGVGTLQSCGGDVWSSWAGQQPSNSAYGFDGYQWLLDGSPITGATGTSYTPLVTAANLGHQLSCEVTVTYTLFPTTVSATSAAVTLVDLTPPVLSLPAPIVVDATGPAGAAVSYTVTATDNVGTSVTVSCVPVSGSTFAIGSTTVNCTATAPNITTGHGSFTVNVKGHGHHAGGVVHHAVGEHRGGARLATHTR